MVTTPEVAARLRVVEVIASLGDGHRRYGSGYLLGARQVLTAAHVVAGAIEASVRWPDKSSMPADLTTALIGDLDVSGLDLAILDVPGSDSLPAVPIAIVNRDVSIGVFLEDCSAVGYPQFMDVPHPGGRVTRETVQVKGQIAPLSGLVAELLSLEVTPTPRDLPTAGTTLDESSWSGMSGAAVFARDGPPASEPVLLGVVAEHAPRRGQSHITVMPLDRIAKTPTLTNPTEWWARLGVANPQDLPLLPTGSRTAVAVRIHNVPDLPPHFVDRAETDSAIKAAVLSAHNRLVGLYGMGGTGKSVAAARVARDPEVQRAFPDGIIWVTIGQQPDEAIIRQRQQEVAEALGDPSRTFSSTEQGKVRLSALLQDRRCLIVLDDVWRSQDVVVFGNVDADGRMLITTRQHALITNLGGDEVRLDVLNRAQVLALLADWIGQSPDSLPPAAGELAEECGNLPLALAMVGAMLRGKPDRFDNVLHKLRSRSLDQIGRDFPNYPYPNLFRAIEVSVEALESDSVRERYFDFAVFANNARIPIAALDTYWQPRGLDMYDVQDVSTNWSTGRCCDAMLMAICESTICNWTFWSNAPRILERSTRVYSTLISSERGPAAGLSVRTTATSSKT